MNSNCIFCQISERTESDDFKLFENGHLFVKLSINPLTQGHALVVPKKHFERLIDIPESVLSGIMQQAVKYGERTKEVLQAKAFVIKINNELFQLEVGQGHISHIHIHIIPRYGSEEDMNKIPERVSNESLLGVKRLLYSN